MKLPATDISEDFKAGVHLALFGLSVAAGLYNWAESQERNDTHLKVNAVTYAGLALYEVVQIHRHIHARDV